MFLKIGNLCFPDRGIFQDILYIYMLGYYTALKWRYWKIFNDMGEHKVTKSNMLNYIYSMTATV